MVTARSSGPVPGQPRLDVREGAGADSRSPAGERLPCSVSPQQSAQPGAGGRGPGRVPAVRSRGGAGQRPPAPPDGAAPPGSRRAAAPADGAVPTRCRVKPPGWAVPGASARHPPPSERRAQEPRGNQGKTTRSTTEGSSAGTPGARRGRGKGGRPGRRQAGAGGGEAAGQGPRPPAPLAEAARQPPRGETAPRR